MIQPNPVALASAAFLLTPFAPAQTASFEPFRVVAFNSVPTLENSITADVNGDGIPDVLALGAVQNGGRRLYLSEGLGSRAFAPAVVVPTPDLSSTGPIFNVTGLEAADLDGDGDLDVVTTTADRRFLALRNDGTGSFDAPAVPSHPALQIDGVADADADGALDVFITTPDERVEIGRLDPATWTFTFEDSGVDAAGVRAADLDGDGRAEIIAQVFGLRVFPATPTGYGAPIAVTSVGVFPFAPFSLVIDDLDGDGNLDLFQADAGGLLNAFLGDGSLGFTEVDLLPSALTSPPEGTKRLVDANGDGVLDLLYWARLNGDPFNTTTLVSLGNGTFPFPEGSPQGQPFGPFGPVVIEPQVFFQDVDGDGATDLVKDGTVQYGPFAGPPIGFQATGTYLDASGLAEGKRGPRAVDVDGDGRLDLAAVDAISGNLTWQRNLGALQFGTSEDLSPFGAQVVDLSVGAFEAGRPDVLAEVREGAGGNELRVWREVAGAGLGPSAPIATTASRILGIVDLDGDGIGDVATTEGFHPLDASGDPGALVPAPAFSVQPNERAAFDDIDDDGDVDLVRWIAGPTSSRSIDVALNTSNGQTFTGPSSVTLTTGAVALADIDGDGTTDIVSYLFGPSNAVLEVQLGQGALSFGAPVALSTTLPPNPAFTDVRIQAVDVDGDGDDDIAVAPFFTAALVGQAVWLNEPGAPAVSNFASVFSKALVGGSGGFADLDGDGDLDAFDVEASDSLLASENTLVPSIGAVFCEQPFANSSGLSGRLDAYGSPSSAGNPIRLVANRLPLNTFGFVVGSPNAVAPAPLANSIGQLCLGAGLGRYSQPSEIGVTGGAGSFELEIAPDDLRTGGTTVTATAGLTWSFQAWHRDVGGAFGLSNLTSGLTVTYQ
ncbi:MAG: VCBS repeat-containing protein [Planctomycetota bacterium]